MDSIDKALVKYDIDTTACTQRTICGYVKNASYNVADGRANQVEKILNGLTRYILLGDIEPYIRVLFDFMFCFKF